MIVKQDMEKLRIFKIKRKLTFIEIQKIDKFQNKLLFIKYFVCQYINCNLNYYKIT